MSDPSVGRGLKRSEGSLVKGATPIIEEGLVVVVAPSSSSSSRRGRAGGLKDVSKRRRLQ